MQVLAHNLAAQFTNRQLNITTDKKAKSSEKLSSGYKINRSADDAAGLSISEKMRKQIRGLNRASENVQDGISLCQVADGALGETTEILQRMRQLSVQAANGTNSESDRSAIQKEIDQLTEEVDRIAETTSFNESIHPLNSRTINGIQNDKVSTITQKTILENYPGYIDADGKQHYVLGSGVFKIENLTDVVLDVSGQTTLVDTNLKNVSIQCEQGTTLNVSNVVIDNSANISKDMNGVGSAIQFKGSGNVLNCYGNNEFNGGMDNYKRYTDSLGNASYYIACAGINVGSNAELTINGTATSNLIAHGCVSKNFVSYGREGYNIDSVGIGSNFHEDGGTIVINSGNINAYADIEERLGMGQGCIGGGNNVSITINGGIVNAYGGCDIAIGGGDTAGDSLFNLGNANIVINGGKIKVDGGNASPALGFVANGEITINGGTVVAEGHDSQSIAIGGGNEYASNAIININGGMITAISDGSNGTAIGFYSSVDSKYNSQSPLDGKIYFSGGTVVAKLVDSSTNSPIDLVKLFNGNVYNGNLEIYEDGNLATTLSETNDGNGHRQYTYSGAYTAPTEPTNLIDNLDTSNLKNVIGTVKQDNVNTATSLKNDTIWIQAGADTGDGFSLSMVIATAKGLGIKEPDISVMSEANCDDAMNRLGDAIEKVSSYRSLFGAQQNRLECAKSVDDNTAENTTAAESRIRDTDMAEEMVNFSKNNILAQVGQSMLAQANQSTQGILSLHQ